MKFYQAVYQAELRLAHGALLANGNPACLAGFVLGSLVADLRMLTDRPSMGLVLTDTQNRLTHEVLPEIFSLFDSQGYHYAVNMHMERQPALFKNYQDIVSVLIHGRVCHFIARSADTFTEDTLRAVRLSWVALAENQPGDRWADFDAREAPAYPPSPQGAEA